MGEAGCQRDKGSPSRCQRDRGVWGSVWPAIYVFFYMHTCVRSVYVCPLGIHTQPCSRLDLGAWSCGSPASARLSDLDRFPPTCKHQVGCYIPACLHRTAQSTACQLWGMACLVLAARRRCLKALLALGVAGKASPLAHRDSGRSTEAACEGIGM